MTKKMFFTVMASVFLLTGCSALDKVGDSIDDSCARGTLDVTQSYVDTYNDYLKDKGRKFRIDGVTCTERDLS